MCDMIKNKNICSINGIVYLEIDGVYTYIYSFTIVLVPLAASNIPLILSIQIVMMSFCIILHNK